MLGPQPLEVLLEEGAHGDDAVRHALDLAEPLGAESGVVEDFRGDARAVDGGVGVHGAHEDLDLRVDPLLLLGGLAEDGEGADALAVEALLLLASPDRQSCGVSR